jgi:hypothetical protein
VRQVPQGLLNKEKEKVRATEQAEQGCVFRSSRAAFWLCFLGVILLCLSDLPLLCPSWLFWCCAINLSGRLLVWLHRLSALSHGLQLAGRSAGDLVHRVLELRGPYRGRALS